MVPYIFGTGDGCAQAGIQASAVLCYGLCICIFFTRFLQRSFQNPDLRGAQKLHSAACLAGMALFAIEDASVPHIPLVHASWHCLSAWGTAMVNHVLADAEGQWPELTLDALTVPGGPAEQPLQDSWSKPGLDIAPLGMADSSSSSSLSSSSFSGGV
jgi:hypothetical protein